MSHYDDASNFSDLSSLDGSDEFGRKLLQHTKDARRISALTSSHAFRKAKPLPRAALNLDNLEHNNQYNPPSYQPEHHPASLSGSTASDPPLNPPRAWGRKGRPNHTWMRSIHDQPQTNIQSSPNIDWADAANDSLYSSANVSPPTRRAHTIERQAIVEEQDSYIDQWNPDQDFSAASLLVSTPAVPSLSRLTIDQIREREVQSYEARASSSTRRQVRQQTVNETLSPSYRDNYARPSSAQGPKPTSFNKENIPLAPRQSARSLYKTVETTESMPAITPRPAQRKADSLALLKRLSRTPSASPSPTSAKDTMQATNPPRQDTAWSDKYPKQSTRSLFRGDSPQAPEVVKGPELIYVEQGDSSQAPEIVEIPEPAPSEPMVTPSRPLEQQLPAKTPVVMGAWIDTPQTARQSNNSATSQADRRTFEHPKSVAEDSHHRSISEPNLPSSALDAVLKDLRNGKRREDDDPTLGDSTIASLEDVMAPSADNTLRLDLPNVPLAQPPYSQTKNKQDTARADTVEEKQEPKSGFKDDAQISQQDAGLRQRWSALGGVKKMLGGTSAISKPKPQTKNSRALDEAIASASRGSTSRLSDTQGVHQHVAGKQCVQCGRPTSVLRAAWNEYWVWYFRRDSRAPLGFRLTWLGLACTMFWTWLVIEWTLSSIVSPPRYATKMRGFGVDPHAPRFPYVLPTLASRPLTPLISPLASSAAWLWKTVWGQQKYRYYPADPGAFGSAAKVKIGPPGPRSAYYTSSNIVDDVRWADQDTTGQAWHTKEDAQRSTWSAWETNGDGSMLEDEIVV
ncbi:unnamed protein product [Aureobasidium vineae]|uniref:Uncharacterized protein n=1 Tax=Aureobasidium vineae TaxID=2773715 RepID=A0A9N8J7N9_9PEZI|nr:unnamed protein product [Aureobasidium vineae]